MIKPAEIEIVLMVSAVAMTTVDAGYRFACEADDAVTCPDREEYFCDTKDNKTACLLCSSNTELCSSSHVQYHRHCHQFCEVKTTTASLPADTSPFNVTAKVIVVTIATEMTTDVGGDKDSRWTLVFIIITIVTVMLVALAIAVTVHICRRRRRQRGLRYKPPADVVNNNGHAHDHPDANEITEMVSSGLRNGCVIEDADADQEV